VAGIPDARTVLPKVGAGQGATSPNNPVRTTRGRSQHRRCPPRRSAEGRAVAAGVSYRGAPAPGTVDSRPDEARLGVTTAAIAEAVRVATIGDYDATLAKSDRRPIPVRVQLTEASRSDSVWVAAMRAHHRGPGAAQRRGRHRGGGPPSSSD
jgi:hypothetical protein